MKNSATEEPAETDPVYENLVGCKFQLDLSKLVDFLKQQAAVSKGNVDEIRTMKEEMWRELQTLREGGDKANRRLDQFALDLEQLNVSE